MNATATNTVLSVFGLQDQEAALARAFRATDAAIHGGAALSWYLNTPPPPGQDIDIWCQPTESILRPVIYALYDNIFRAACYRPARSYSRDVQRASYYKTRDLHIDAIHEWTHPTLDRKIQLIFRATHNGLGIAVPKSPTDGFDLDITSVKVSFSPLSTSRLALEPIPADLADRIQRRVMRINNLKGQQLDNNLRRIRKYYDRGFAFETTETTCSCTCGALCHAVVIPPRRLTLEEAKKLVRKEWVAANPLTDSNPLRADTLRAVLYRNKPLDEMDMDSLSDTIHICCNAMALVQNHDLFPAETVWIDEYLETAVFVRQNRSLQRSWTNCCSTRRHTIGITGLLQRFRVIQGSAYMKHFPVIATENERIVKEIHDWQRGVLRDDATATVVGPAPIPPKKVVKKVIAPVAAPTLDMIVESIPMAESQELTRTVMDGSALPAVATTTDKIAHA